jgi:hypothetical protein
LEDNLVIVREVSKDVIIQSIKDLHNWKFYENWKPLSKESIDKYWNDKSELVILEIEVE